MSKYLIYSFISFLLFSLLVLSGCSEPGGGAMADVQVQPKVSNLKIFNAEETDPEEDDGGGTSGEKKKPGTLTGRIIVEGTVPQLKLLVVKGNSAVKDAKVCAATNIPDEKIIVGKDGGLANVFIYLAKPPKRVKIPEAPKTTLAFNNIGCRFEPHVLLVRTGQRIHIKNLDPIAHNTNTNPSRNNKFNEAVDKAGTVISYKKREKIPVLVKCDFHTWMRAYHLPLDHPYAAITDKEGRFAIKDLPPGKHEFLIWHESGGDTLLSTGYAVVIDGNQQVEIKFNSEEISSLRGLPPKTINLSALP